MLFQVALPVDLLRFAQRGAQRVGADRLDDGKDGGLVEAQAVQRAERPLDVLQRLRAGRGTAAHEVHHPGVPVERRPHAAGQRPQVRPPVAGRFRCQLVALDGVDHEVEQLLLGRDVPVQRHRPRVELARDPPHADRVRPFGVRDPDRRPHDLVAGQRGRALRYVPGAPFHVLFHVPPEAGGVAVLGTEGQEGCPQFLVVCCHRGSFLARQACWASAAVAGPTADISAAAAGQAGTAARAAVVLPSAGGPGLRLVHRTVIVQRTNSTPYDDDRRDGMGEIPAIETERLTKSFGATQALSGLDLSVPQGGILGLLGPNGAGKTTAVRVLATLLRPDSGHARVLGADVVRDAAEVRHLIGLTGQYAALDEYLTGRANLVMIGQLSRLSRSQARRRAGELLARFDLTHAAGRAVKTYSGGMRRRLDLAASLIGRPEVLFLDEPTTGLDPNSRAVMWEIIRELAAEGTTLLLTTQYLDEADQLANQVAVIDVGRVVAEGTPDQLKAKVGEDRIAVQLAPGSDLAAAVAVVRAQTTGPVEADPGQLLVTAQMPARDGITTDVVRALDTAGVRVSDVTLRRSSLDDVFMILTGHRAAPEPGPGPMPADGDAGPETMTGQGGAAA